MSKRITFLIENISASSGRLGLLVHPSTGKHFQTPILIQCTKFGSIPHLSREVFDYITKDVQILQMSLVTMDKMVESIKDFNDQLSAYVGYKDFPSILTIRDPCSKTPSGGNDKDVVPLFTYQGKESFNATRYMKFIEIFSPDIYQGLCDADTDIMSSKKRVQKSVERSADFFNVCYDHHISCKQLSKSALFAPIVGGFNKYARSQSIKNVASKPPENISGYVFEGFHKNGLSATEVDLNSLLEIMSHCANELDAEKPKMMIGGYTPLAVLELMRLNVDIFDASYAYLCTANFKALTFNYDLSNNIPEKAFIDVTNPKYKQDFSPLLKGCACLSCKKHTKAYVNHLYNTRELLGPILLMIHNIHHYMCFFEAARKSISANNMADLIDLIKFQSTDTEVDYSIKQFSDSKPNSYSGSALFAKSLS